MKYVALSEISRCGEPRCAMNLQRAVTHISVVRLSVVSKGIAQVVKYANKQIYLLMDFWKYEKVQRSLNRQFCIGKGFHLDPESEWREDPT